MSFFKKVKVKLEDRGAGFVAKKLEEEYKKGRFNEKQIKNSLPLTTKERLGMVLFFGIFFLIGFVLFYFTYSWITNGLESNNWQSVEGAIISSQFISGRTSENKPFYSAEILYEYYIDNVKYLSNSITSGGQSSSNNPNYAQKIVRKYSEGDKINVYYNPQNPEQSVLEPGFHWSDAWPALIGLLFALIGLIGVIFSILGKRIGKVEKNF